MKGRHIAKRKGPSPALRCAIAVLVAVILAAVCAAVGFGICAARYSGIFPGVTMAGIPLEGQTVEEAESLLEKQLPKWLDSQTISVTADGDILLSCSPSSIGAAVSPSCEAGNAWAAGREEGVLGWLKNGFTLVRCLLGHAPRLEPEVIWERTALEKAVEKLALKFDRAPADPVLEADSSGLYLTTGRDGRALEQKALADAIVAHSGAVEASWKILPAAPTDLKSLTASLSAQASPAGYDPETQQMTGGSPGVVLDLPGAEKALKGAKPGQRIRLPAQVSCPYPTAQELNAVLFRDALGSASTKLPAEKARRNNIRLAGEAVSGLVLESGDVFDFNQSVGERTKEKGYSVASGVLGGGISQVTGTIYLASLLSNLEIVERHANARQQSNIAPGMDAAISWGGPEFRFKNNTEYPIRIDVSCEDDQLTVTLTGTKTDDHYVKMTHSVLSTTSFSTKKVETKNLPLGSQKQVQNGIQGCVVQSFRNVYSGDGTLISSVPEAKSSYQSRDAIIHVGIGETSDPDEPVLPPENPPM